MVIYIYVYIQYKFQELPSVDYRVMAEDRKSDRWMDKPEGRMDISKPISEGGGEIISI